MRLLFADAALVVVDKPAGQIVHPAPGHETGALTDELLRRYPDMAGVGSTERPGVVHRLDIDTSGVMVFARTRAAYLSLRRQFEAHDTVEKTYLAVCHWRRGCAAQGTLTRPIDRQRAVSRYTLLGRQGALALVRFDIETGRTHQIRVHMASLGRPVIGDAVYGKSPLDKRLTPVPPRQMLHAWKLRLWHPCRSEQLSFEAPIPSDMQAYMSPPLPPTT